MNFLNPSFWLAVVLWTAVVAGGSYMKGSHDAESAAKLREAAITQQAKAEQHAEDLKTLQLERTMRAAMQERYDAYQEEQRRAKMETDALIADLRAGRRRLSIPARAHCPASAGANPTAAGRTGEEGRAELDHDTSRALIALTDRGDDAIRKHAAVVDLYEAARKACARQIDPENHPSEK